MIYNPTHRRLNPAHKPVQVRKDGSRLSLMQSKKMSQLSADNAQWEDRQLFR